MKPKAAAVKASDIGSAGDSSESFVRPAVAATRNLVEASHIGRIVIDEGPQGYQVIDQLLCMRVRLPTDSDWDIVYNDDIGHALLGRQYHDGREDAVVDPTEYIPYNVFLDDASGDLCFIKV